MDASIVRTASHAEGRYRVEPPLDAAMGPRAPSRLADASAHCRRLLVCLDSSASSRACAPHAVSIAKTFGSAITLAHVMAPTATGLQSNDAVGWEILRQESRRYLERMQAELSQELGRPVELRLEQGRPADRITSLARETAADIIVIGSRGDGGAAAGAFGSTALGVLATARTSLLVAHPEASEAWAPPTRILLPLDGSIRSESVLPIAARMASDHDAELLLVHVVQEPMPSALLPAPEEMDLARSLARSLESGAKHYLERLREQLAHRVKSVRTLVVRRASQHQCLLEVSRREGVDFVVLSAHGSACDAARSFGSVTACLMTQTLVPVMALQDLGEADLVRGMSVDAAPGLPQGYALRAAETA